MEEEMTGVEHIAHQYQHSRVVSYALLDSIYAHLNLDPTGSLRTDSSASEWAGRDKMECGGGGCLASCAQSRRPARIRSLLVRTLLPAACQ